MGGLFHKLLAEFDGVPLVRRMAEIAVLTSPETAVVVTGHRHTEVEACLNDLGVVIKYNPLFGEGLASSIVAGIHVPCVAEADGILILLADMPAVTVYDLQRLIEAFNRWQRDRMRDMRRGTGQPRHFSAIAAQSLVQVYRR